MLEDSRLCNPAWRSRSWGAPTGLNPYYYFPRALPWAGPAERDALSGPFLGNGTNLSGFWIVAPAGQPKLAQDNVLGRIRKFRTLKGWPNRWITNRAILTQEVSPEIGPPFQGSGLL